MKYLVLLLALLCFGNLPAQEFNINVSIQTPKLKNADPKIFVTLEKTISELINNTAWTDSDFEPEEKIEGSIQLNITDDMENNSFVADLLISTSRPVYNSNYYTPILNYIEKGITFGYEEFTPLYNNRNSYSDNLSAILSYYVYIILGYDFDTFSAFGGERYFQIAQNVIDQVPINVRGSDASWTSSNNSNTRFRLIDDMLDPKMRDYRQAVYNYHLLGLDQIAANEQRARAEINSALKTMDDVHRIYPNSMVMQMFTDSKRDEIVEIFKGAGNGERKKVYDIMVRLNPSQANLYGEIR